MTLCRKMLMKAGPWMAAGVGMMLVSGSVLAGPPFLTDDPEPVNYQYHEFYIASQMQRTADGTSITLPHIEFNDGVLPDVQLHLLAPLQLWHPEIGARHYGYGDTELGIKYRFVQESDNIPMIGIFPLVELPTGNINQGLGNGKVQYFLPVWLQKKWGAWQSYGGGGYWVNKAPDQKNHWFWGWQLQKDISEQWTLGGELFYTSAQAPSQGDSVGFNLGGNYNFSEKDHLLFSAGYGLKNVSENNRGIAYLAYQRTW